LSPTEISLHLEQEEMSLASNFVLVFAVIVGLTAASDLHCCMSKKIYGKGLIVTATLKNGSSSPVMTQVFYKFEFHIFIEWY
jgi:hypothetical protein